MNEQAKAQKQTKKQISYTYWVDSNNKSRQLPLQHQPKKVEGPIEPVIKQQGPSAWNSCGTWEEKKISFLQLETDTKQQIINLLQKNQINGFQLSTVKLEGDAYKVFKKNKWSVLYDIKGSIQFKNQEKKAKINIIQISNLGDRQFEVTGSLQIRKLIEPHSNNFVKAIQDVLAKHNN